MRYTYAIIYDPDWRLMYRPWPVWNDPNVASSQLAQWKLRVKQHFNALPPAELVLTALSRDDQYHIPWIWQDAVPSPHQYTWPHELVRSVHKIDYMSHKNFSILSNKTEVKATKTRPAGPVPNFVAVNTHYGIMNANASNDAIERMLTNRKYKIDHIVIIDPGQRIAHTQPWKFPPSSFNLVGVAHEVWTAHTYAQMNPHIACTIIT